MDSPAYRGAAALLVDGREIEVEAELLGDVPRIGLPGWTGVVHTTDVGLTRGEIRTGRIRLPGGWEGGFAVIRTVLGMSTVWVRGNDQEASPVHWPH
ncbi:hypothetical protein ACIRPK_06740 [Kitasatospora sp. NPDC101801]|uniref:hypothetical protein n=1 Tax=Kitasatospora sp. NPDC101801 TaxID=3364103 RepID=UPI0037FE8925